MRKCERTLTHKEVEDRALALYLVGSKAYGLDTPASDTDYAGIFIDDPKYYGFSNLTIDQKSGPWPTSTKFPMISGCKDIHFNEIRKQITLLGKGSPNQIELLFAEDNLIYCSSVWKLVIGFRHNFITQSIKECYIGYAESQIRKMESHFKWLNDPPKKLPVPEDFGLESDTTMSKSEFNAFLHTLWELLKDRFEFINAREEFLELVKEKIDYKSILINHDFPLEGLPYIKYLTSTDDAFIDTYQRIKQYRRALDNWKSYQKWLANRNPARAALEAKVGYDCKHACQCLRLLYQAKDLITTNTLKVNTSGAYYHTFLRNIKEGKISYERFIEVADFLFNKVASLDVSHLPTKVTLEYQANLLAEIHKLYKS